MSKQAQRWTLGDMQRLTDQQQRLLAPPSPPRLPLLLRPPRGSSWSHSGPQKLPPPAPPGAPQLPERSCPGPGPSGPHPAAPNTRPAGCGWHPLTRVLTPPHDVDSLPHLRKFSPEPGAGAERAPPSSWLRAAPEEPAARPGLIEIPLSSLEEPAAEDEGDGSPPWG